MGQINLRLGDLPNLIFVLSCPVLLVQGLQANVKLAQSLGLPSPISEYLKPDFVGSTRVIDVELVEFSVDGLSKLVDVYLFHCFVDSFVWFCGVEVYEKVVF